MEYLASFNRRTHTAAPLADKMNKVSVLRISLEGKRRFVNFQTRVFLVFLSPKKRSLANDVFGV